MKSLLIGLLAVWLSAVAVDYIRASELCNPAIYRCVGNQLAFAYQRRSECNETATELDCAAAPVRCVCIEVEKVCHKAIQYSNASTNPAETTTAGSSTTATASSSTTTTGSNSTGSTSAATGTATTPTMTTTGTTSTASTSPAHSVSVPVSELCQVPYAGDGSACLIHRNCAAIPGGVSLCCRGHCRHVQNVPCVRGFFKQEDRLCDDTQYKTLFSAALVNNADE